MSWPGLDLYRCTCSGKGNVSSSERRSLIVRKSTCVPSCSGPSGDAGKRGTAFPLFGTLENFSTTQRVSCSTDSRPITTSFIMLAL